MWYVGLDLGQAADYSALVALDREDRTMVYRCRHLYRFPLNTAYTAQVDQVIAWLVAQKMDGCQLVVDHTGVGRAVVDLLIEKRPPVVIVPITITAGTEFVRDRRGGYHVPKKDVVTSLNLVLQQRRLRIPKTLSLADTLAIELGNFKVKITAAANETFGAWREGQHDDLVLALALATWYSEQQARYFGYVARVGEQPLVYRETAEDGENRRSQLSVGDDADKPREPSLVELLTGRRPGEHYREHWQNWAFGDRE